LAGWRPASKPGPAQGTVIPRNELECTRSTSVSCDPSTPGLPRPGVDVPLAVLAQPRGELPLVAGPKEERACPAANRDMRHVNKLRPLRYGCQASLLVPEASVVDSRI
jgi:hypothetical protein